MSLIVSVTSISSRLPVLRHTLISLLDQHCKPDRIVLLLSKEPYLMDDGVNDPPPWLDAMVARRDIELQWVENTGPYRKLMPLYRTATDDDVIVTCDDDVIYGPEWLSSLMQTAKEHPDAIVCGRARRPAKNPLGRRKSYLIWQVVPPGSSGPDLLPIGIAGVVYRKPLLDPGIMLSDDYKTLAPKQDDLWFDLARRVTGAEVVVANMADNFAFPIKTPSTLSETNLSNKVADWNNIVVALYDRLQLKVWAYLGACVCDNDKVIRRLDAYAPRASRRT